MIRFIRDVHVCDKARRLADAILPGLLFSFLDGVKPIEERFGVQSRSIFNENKIILVRHHEILAISYICNTCPPKN